LDGLADHQRRHTLIAPLARVCPRGLIQINTGKGIRH